ncbi:alpha-L-arabinofuranosidase C-terminal domain-containing protein [Lewinella sp. IMCC34183]|uniref:alpha-L-arabinofuranosidase C-terminal domain-containing protein n=1 Tax=Lewinella sp. IMCC34183 TaxID=2248762 RepID=UPI001E4AEDCB|nr:alpha-L-arabinofuranosidase C-terminal domain-containing protein [Lewinella sp. IMCC34183]
MQSDHMSFYFSARGHRVLLLLLFVIGGLTLSARTAVLPDSVYLFGYAQDEEGRSGLNIAWSVDREQWYSIGDGFRFLASDFGAWGAQKRMFDPYLYQEENGRWHCVWSLNDTIQQVAHAASDNLYEWDRQSYPVVMDAPGNVLSPEVTLSGRAFLVSWRSDGAGEEGVYQLETDNFRDFSTTAPADRDVRKNDRETVQIDGTEYFGTVHRVAWELVDDLIKHYEWMRFHNAERAETMAEDPVRFAGLQPLEANIYLQPDDSKPISENLIGIFFEDISYAADGGLYAELVQNRDFEYDPADKKYNDPNWNAQTAWSVTGDAAVKIRTDDPIHENNPHYAALTVTKKGAAMANEGWTGIPVRAGEVYDASLFVRGRGAVTLRLVGPDGKVLGEGRVRGLGRNWKKLNTEITAEETVDDAHLEVVPDRTGRTDLDMVSLFPRNTFRGRKNGLRKDLAETIAALNPKFVRFPGGCVAHGDGLGNMYRWENTIGPLESRVPQRNIWNYHQSAGLGYYEYFLFCEDLDALPIPVVPAGVPCQNSAVGGHGQQCGIPLEDMDAYTQSILNLIEYANGDATTEWGRKRAEAGHPEPFNLKYLGVGNEDLITDVFEERFRIIYEAVTERYPDIEVIGTVGPFYMGTDYKEGWELARELDIPLVDEHYYQPPGWFINNQDFYDKYDRDGTKVYLGEYAAHLPGRPMNVETALSEALYLTAVERNGDVVEMTSFAPLLAKEGNTNWNPDLIYFNNTEVKTTVDYYVQQLYGQNAGNLYIPSKVSLSDGDRDVRERVGVSVVRDEATGDLILKLANLLPVAVSATINPAGLDLRGEATVTVLQGEPDDRDARPVESTMNLSGEVAYEMPAYSFTVIRVGTAKR